MKLKTKQPVQCFAGAKHKIRELPVGTVVGELVDGQYKPVDGYSEGQLSGWHAVGAIEEFEPQPTKAKKRSAPAKETKPADPPKGEESPAAPKPPQKG